MVSLLNFGLRSLGFKHGLGRCVVFLDSFSPPRCINGYWQILGKTLTEWTCIPSRQSRNTPNCVMLQNSEGVKHSEPVGFKMLYF